MIRGKQLSKFEGQHIMKFTVILLPMYSMYLTWLLSTPDN